MAKDDKIISEAKERFKLAQDAEAENRQNWEDDVKFARMGEQWPDAVKRQRERDGRPCLTVNRMPAFIRQVVNDARMNTPQIKFHPVDDHADKETAKVLNGLMKNIEYTSNADVAYDTALECAVSGGFGYFRVNLDYTQDDAFDLDILIERIVNPLTVYGDPASEAADASDWRFGFITELVPKEEFERKWGKDKVDWDTYGDGKDLEWFKDDTIRIAEYWKREEIDRPIVKLSNGAVMDRAQYDENADLFSLAGIQVVSERSAKSHKVTQYLLTGAGILETNEWPGKYIPIIPVYGDEVFVNGKRYLNSLTRFAKDAQRQYNYWRTTATELIALAPRVPFIGPKGAFNTDSGKWATANSVSHAYIEYDGATQPQRQPLDVGGGASALQQALQASDDMKSIMGLYDASLGARSNETSGKAIMARQREGDVSTFNFIDNLSRALRYAGRVINDLIPKVYDKARIIRTIGEDDSTEAVMVNQEFDADGTTRLHDLTTGKYDVTVDTGPSFTTKREEAATQMVELLRSFPAAAPIIGDLVAKNLDWPGAEQIAERLKMLLPPQIQKAESQKGIPPEAQAVMAAMDQQIAQMQQQMQMGMAKLTELSKENDKLKLDNANKQAEIAARLEEAKLDAMTKIQVTEMNNQQEGYKEVFSAFMKMMKQQQGELRGYIDQKHGEVINSIPKQSPQTVIYQGRRKKVAIQAPSGAVYQGVVEDDDEAEEQ